MPLEVVICIDENLAGRKLRKALAPLTEFVVAIAPLRFALIDEQVKLNDPGASLYLLNSLAKDGWDGVLRRRPPTAE